MGRPRIHGKDLAPGYRLIKGRVYFQPTTASERRKRVECFRSIPRDAPLVYFIRAKNGSVKVGFTSSRDGLNKRLSMLRVGSPLKLTLIGAVAGSIEDEQRAHAELREWHCGGEWFVRSPYVTKYVKHVLALGFVPELGNSENKLGNEVTLVAE